MCRPVFSQRRKLVPLIRTKGEQRNLTKARLKINDTVTATDTAASVSVWLRRGLERGLGGTADINRISMKPDNTSTAETREVHPEIEPFDSGFLSVSELHQVYYEQSGNADGKPVLFL